MNGNRSVMDKLIEFLKKPSGFSRMLFLFGILLLVPVISTIRSIVTIDPEILGKDISSGISAYIPEVADDTYRITTASTTATEPFEPNRTAAVIAAISDGTTTANPTEQTTTAAETKTTEASATTGTTGSEAKTTETKKTTTRTTAEPTTTTTTTTAPTSAATTTAETTAVTTTTTVTTTSSTSTTSTSAQTTAPPTTTAATEPKPDPTEPEAVG